MIEGVLLKRMKVLPNNDGWLEECLTRDDEIFEKFGQICFLGLRPNRYKSYHSHKEQTEYIGVVSGTIQISLCDERQDSASFGADVDYIASERNPIVVKVPPGVAHKLYCMDNKESVIFVISTEVFDQKNPDIITKKG